MPQDSESRIEQTARAVQEYLLERRDFAEPLEVRFLAAGEYNENYLVDHGGGQFVFRINHGSQLGLDDQISYEYRVLETVAPSGVTPRPLFVDPEPERLPGGVLMMEYVHGGPLVYERDLDRAARIFARIHALPAADNLVVQDRAVADIAEESIGLIHRHPDHPRARVRDLLLAYHEEVMRLYEDTRHLFEAEDMVCVNTEVNSNNFVIGADHSWLVDWEKAVVSHRYQDLGHFVVVTTSLWKTPTILTEGQKRNFLETYGIECERLGSPAPPLDELAEKTRVLEKTILLRALSWCYMAWYEYTRTDRPITNTDTFAKISEYLDNAECYLR
ncbi:MAG: phosphotransferase family protein [Desulfatibacillaceae bacterium]